MSDIPNELVGWRIENIMQRDRQLDDAEAGAKMPAGHGNGADGFFAYFVGNLLQVPRIDTAEIGWNFNVVEKRANRLNLEFLFRRCHATYPYGDFFGDA